MINLIKKCWNNSVLRYIFFGGCTTLVNLISYFLLRTFTSLGVNASNIISVSLAILFAYFVNAIFVFRSEAETFAQKFNEFCKFVGARLSTMVIEVGGVWLIVEVLGGHDFIAKFAIQFIVLVLNYIISKFFVFIKKNNK